VKLKDPLNYQKAKWTVQGIIVVSRSTPTLLLKDTHKDTIMKEKRASSNTYRRLTKPQPKPRARDSQNTGSETKEVETIFLEVGGVGGKKKWFVVALCTSRGCLGAQVGDTSFNPIEVWGEQDNLYKGILC